ncbi:MAG: HAD family hydrolase [Hymenobacteraceae bacterium]|nr:HAD family hydrolase [Hymenobacteraceae bacterium]
MERDVDSLIFDLDGTLWDASETVARAWRAAKSRIDFEIKDITAEDIRAVAGIQHELVYQKLFPNLSKEQHEELEKVSSEEELAHIRKFGGKLYEGMKQTLEYLHDKYKLFIVSNCQEGYIEAFLDFHDLHHYFDDHESSGSTGHPKDENLKTIVSRHSLQSPVYVGDTQGDYEASSKAGIPFVYARYGYREVERYHISISSPKELTELF